MAVVRGVAQVDEEDGPQVEFMKVAYLLHEFPALSETFIRSEVVDHIHSGLDLDVFCMTPAEEQSGSLDDDSRLRARVEYLNMRRPRGLRLPLSAGMDLLQGAPGFRAAARLQAATLTERRRVYCLARAWRTVSKRYDVVHCHFGNYGQRLAALKASGQLPGKLVVSFHGADLSRDRQRDMHDYYRSLFAVGDLFLPISRHWASRLEALGCPADRIRVQHMGVDTEELGRRDRPLRANAHVRIGSIGRFVEKKGHAFTIQALARLKKDHPDLAIYLDLVGDGPLLDQSKELAAGLGIAGLVTFHGALQHQAALSVMSECDLFALPSVTAADGDQEGIPVVLMEAMAMRLPVVSTFHSGIPELVDHDATGLLTAERDVEGLARHIEMLATRPDLRETFGDAGFAKVNAEFSTRKLGAMLRARYQTLVHSNVP